MSLDRISVIIPSLNPDEKLMNTVQGLLDIGFSDIILVDDGSDADTLSYFPDPEQYPEVTILHHPYNRGKGAALRTAFRYVLRERPDSQGVVTADADGQHLPHDIVATVERMLEENKVVLGCRDFNLPGVPKRSRFGNHTTSTVMKLLCGLSVSDTQTGLRAIPTRYLGTMLRVRGDRYEYETNMLLSFKQHHISFCEQTIETVYEDDNKRSHFRPVRDSLRVYKFILGYLLSSVGSALVDEGAYYLFLKVFRFGALSILISAVAARAVSSLFNFTVNKNRVFHSKGSFGRKLIRYYCLALPQMLASVVGVYLVTGLFTLCGVTVSDFGSTLIKALIDTVLFFISFRIQQNWVFADKKEVKKEPKKKEKLSLGTLLKRIGACLLATVLFLVFTLFGVCFTIANGPSESVRNALVLSAKQASATKWVPSLFLDSDTIDEIVENSKKVTIDVLDVNDVNADFEDEWDKAIDGVLYKNVNGPTFRGYMVIIKDPARVSVGVSTDNFATSTGGARFYEIAERYHALIAINAGEFEDIGGVGSGARPMGITYSGGKLVYNDGATNRTYIGFDKENRLIVQEGMTLAEAQKLGIRDLVAFQNNNVLIERNGDSVKVHYKEDDTGTAQRTAIAQRADGSVIMLVTDGRTASCLGATSIDVINVLLENGAVSAAMLDGGSSTMMYYRDYYNKLGLSQDSLDQYQKMGLVNKYKAFTTPRRIPTYFIVSED